MLKVRGQIGHNMNTQPLKLGRCEQISLINKTSRHVLATAMVGSQCLEESCKEDKLNELMNIT